MLIHWPATPPSSAIVIKSGGDSSASVEGPNPAKRLKSAETAEEEAVTRFAAVLAFTGC